jgi:hypothetical protein
MWFAQKLQNEILAMQRKACRPVNTLIGPTLTIIGRHHLDHFVENLNRLVTRRRRFQSNDSRVVVDVHVIMHEPRQKRSSRLSKPTHLEQS